MVVIGGIIVDWLTVVLMVLLKLLVLPIGLLCYW